jgi:type IV pilus assembly protein PilC
MIWVVPAFKEVFTSFGADLPAPTLFVMAISDFFVQILVYDFRRSFWSIYFFFQTWRRSLQMQRTMDRLLLQAPIFGAVIRKATIARWTVLWQPCLLPAFLWLSHWIPLAALPVMLCILTLR